MTALIPLPPCICDPIPSIIHFTLKMEAARSSKILVSYHITTQHHDSKDDCSLDRCENLSNVNLLVI